ncbi:MAG: tRNA pseudouridine(38-40) synthase TruA [Micrococcales bacterium]
MNEPVDTVGGLVRFRVDFGYAGTNFNGWAKQPGLRTVEGAFLEALELVFEPDATCFGLTVAGRTDAGVHAHHQVLHLDLSQTQIKRLGRFSAPDMAEGAIRDRLNSLLDDDIRVHSVAYAPAGFDARFAATYRRYRYRIADGLAVKDPIEAGNTLWTRWPLNLLAMQQAALHLIGLNDFASFCRPRPFSTTIRELREVRVVRRDDENAVVEIHLLADAFCHNMVRSIVGALIAVGEGRATPAEIKARLEASDRSSSYKVVAAKGLTLMEIGYPEPEEMANQVARAKDLRTLEDES